MVLPQQATKYHVATHSFTRLPGEWGGESEGKGYTIIIGNGEEGINPKHPLKKASAALCSCSPPSDRYPA